MSRKSAKPSPSEQALWQHVTRHVTPLTAEEKAAWAADDIDFADMMSVSPGNKKSSSLMISGGPVNKDGHIAPPKRRKSEARAYRSHVPRGHGHSQTARPVPQTPKGQPGFVDKKWQQKLRRGKAHPEAVLDLHGRTQEQAFDILRRFVFHAALREYRCILVITGKGRSRVQDEGDFSSEQYGERRGVLRASLPGWIEGTELRHHVVSYFSANQNHGGEGAYYLILKRKR
tara:strand:- start:4765 stop:5454 length:690 start_codon:yes stop_codon:yes gene_type:complete